MELFLPSVLVIILAALVIMIIIPNFSPLIIVIVSAILLTASTYQHFQFFWNEYQQSTWQTTLKIFAPGLIIVAVFLYIFMVGGSFIMGGTVPKMPEMELPPASTATNAVTSAINNSMNVVSGAANSLANAGANVANSIGNAGASVANSLGFNNTKKNAKAANGGPTGSTLAVL
jgi:S-methylmethionine-dependent homocysteine/selenocysteine methylase